MAEPRTDARLGRARPPESGEGLSAPALEATGNDHASVVGLSLLLDRGHGQASAPTSFW